MITKFWLFWKAEFSAWWSHWGSFPVFWGFVHTVCLLWLLVFYKFLLSLT